MGSVADTAGLLKALSHPARLEIARLLRRGEACVCHLGAHLGYRQAYLSQQIMVLRKGGLVQERRRGTYVFYRLSDARVAKVLDAVLPAVTLTRSSRPPSQRGALCKCPKCTKARGPGREKPARAMGKAN